MRKIYGLALLLSCLFGASCSFEPSISAFEVVQMRNRAEKASKQLLQTKKDKKILQSRTDEIQLLVTAARNEVDDADRLLKENQSLAFDLSKRGGAK